MLYIPGTGANINLSGIEVWKVEEANDQTKLASPLATGSITREVWVNHTSTTFPTGAPTTTNTITVFETAASQGDNYWQRVRGYVCPPVTGEYVFWIAGDDNSELWLSPNEDPALRTRIASASSATSLREWTRFASQRSANVYLEAGKRYYLEALHRETVQADHLAVGWQLPDGSQERSIPGKRLSPFLPVQEADQSVRFYRGLNLNGPAITLDGNQWEGTLPTPPGGTPLNHKENGTESSNSLPNVRLLPATDPTREAMIRSFLWNTSTTTGLRVDLLNVPVATYLVYVYVWEDGAPVDYSLSLEGKQVLPSSGTAKSGTTGSWQRLGPFRTGVSSDKELNLVAMGGINVSGIELWQEGTPPTQPVVVEAGVDWTLAAYSPTHSVVGKVRQVYSRQVALKRYELKDHLGNVRVVVADQKQARLQGNAFLLSALLEGYSHYYPFGMIEPGGSFQAAGASSYRYGYNGKELDKEGMGGGGSTYDYGFRIYNPNIAKFLSVDPLSNQYAGLTPYQFAGNTPIAAIDLDGAEAQIAIDGSVHHGPWNMQKVNDDIIKQQENVRRQAMEQRASTAVGSGTTISAKTTSVSDGQRRRFEAEYKAQEQSAQGQELNPFIYGGSANNPFGFAKTTGEAIHQATYMVATELAIAKLPQIIDAAKLLYYGDQAGTLRNLTGAVAKQISTSIGKTAAGEPIYAIATNKRGPVLTGVYDTKTGLFHMATNEMTGQIPGELHPILQARLDALQAAGGSGYGRSLGAGSHSEIYALNEALWARQARFGKVTEQQLSEFLLHNRSIRGSTAGTGVPPRCADCEVLTQGVRVVH